MEKNYRLMISDQGETERCRNFISSILQKDICPEKELLDQIRMIQKEVRLDIGIKPDCRHCMELVRNAMVIAAYCPFIQVHLMNLERFSERSGCYGNSCVPFVLVNGSYPFFGNRSLKKLIWMIAEVMGRENYGG